MTKFKEYLRAKGVKLECDYEALPYKNLESVETSAECDCVMATAYFNTPETWSVAYNKRGECVAFNSYDASLDLMKLYYGFEYINWLDHMGYAGSEEKFEVMRFMYYNDAEVRIAFKHMRAGIMDEEVFRKWHVKHCLEYMGIL